MICKFPSGRGTLYRIVIFLAEVSDFMLDYLSHFLERHALIKKQFKNANLLKIKRVLHSGVLLGNIPLLFPEALGGK